MHIRFLRSYTSSHMQHSHLDHRATLPPRVCAVGVLEASKFDDGQISPSVCDWEGARGVKLLHMVVVEVLYAVCAYEG